MAFYLKYRPQTLDQLIGQEVVKQTLLTAFNSGKLSHAYLFVGPRGTGKTSTARILAKMVNCQEKNPPCNKCDSCISITNGSNLDLIEIDAASNRGIDDIRALRDNINLAATSGAKKIYIIDEVHMLTTEAFNALLKTLEEPPAHALFILATTEVHKVPKTILSRVQRLDFKLATAGQLMQTLEDIAKKENIQIEPAALQVIAKKADGSFRDGVKLLDQLSALGEKITADNVSRTLISANFDELSELLRYCGDHQGKEALVSIQRMLEVGSGVKEVIISLMEMMRSLVFIKNDLGENLVKPEVGEEQYVQLTELAAKFTIKELINNLNILQSSLDKLKTASIISLPLELAVVEICNQEAVMVSVPVVVPNTPVISHSGVNDLSATKDLDSSPLQDLRPSVQHDKKELHLQKTNATDDVTTPAIALLQEKWTFVLETIRPYNYSLEALLRNVKIIEVSSGSVVLEVPYSFHQRILESPKSRDLLESVLADILGQSVRVSCVLGVKETTIAELANVEVAQDDEIVKIAAEIFNAD